MRNKSFFFSDSTNGVNTPAAQIYRQTAGKVVPPPQHSYFVDSLKIT